MIWWILCAGLVALAGGYLFCLWPYRHPEERKYTAIPYAHRGLFGDGCEENSLPAFHRAVQAGWAIELDVRLSRDGEVVVFHDDSLQRMCGVDALVSDRTWEELEALCLGNTRDRIPRFSQVLSLVDGRVPLLVELKNGTKNKELCDRVGRALCAYTGVYAIESFNPMIVRWFKRHMPHVFRGVLYNNLRPFRKVIPRWIRWILGSMVLNCICRPHFVAFNCEFPNRLPLALVRGLCRGCTIAWTVRGAARPGVPCDTYIFEASPSESTS